jgi:hypothetical protein
MKNEEKEEEIVSSIVAIIKYFD